MICRICGGRYVRGTARAHGLLWHWFCKPDTCARHHRHLFPLEG